MKNQYRIVKQSPNGIFFYNEDYNFFSERFGTVYTNKKTAENKAKYAKKYANNDTDKVEVVKL